MPIRRSIDAADAYKLESGKGDDANFVNALAKGLRIISAFTPDHVRMTTAELCRATGLPKSTVSRLTYTLCKLGYIFVSPDSGEYQLHPRVLTLGYPVMASMDKRHVATPLMQQLAEYSGGTVSLGIRDGLSMILIERSRDRTVRALPLDIGSRLPIATSSMGRAYYALASLDEKKEILSLLRVREAENFKELKDMLEYARQEYLANGYVSAIGSWEHDVNAVGTAVRLSNETLAAFNCGGPSSRIRSEDIEDLGQRLCQLARDFQVADWIGQLPPRPYKGAV